MTFALHEVLELHEITAFKCTCLIKSKTMKGLVSDPALQAILQADVDTGTRQLEELGGLLNRSGAGGTAI